MGDYRYAEAVDTVAKRVVRSAAMMCGEYDSLDLNGDTLRAIQGRVCELVDLMAPDEGSFETAHDYLQEHAHG